MYLTSFIHREELLEIAERWFLGRPRQGDSLRLTKILICDGFVIGETLRSVMEKLLAIIYEPPFQTLRLYTKKDLRDAICRSTNGRSARVETLADRYLKNPEFFFQETPINGLIWLDNRDRMLGSCRIKRPKRIAEKANRRIAEWILNVVRKEARGLAERRAVFSGVTLDELFTSDELMIREFMEAESRIAQSFRQGSIRFVRDRITIHDVGGIKIHGEKDQLELIEKTLRADSSVHIIDRECFSGNYEATSLVLRVAWDRARVCRKYLEGRCWEKHIGRGIPESELREGLEPFLEGSDPYLNIELILSTFEAMVESELGSSIHEERVITQRENKAYKGYIPMNVEFLLEYLFAVGFSPEVNNVALPIKLWGRYLPEALGAYIRKLHHLPDYDFCF